MRSGSWLTNIMNPHSYGEHSCGDGFTSRILHKIIEIWYNIYSFIGGREHDLKNHNL